MSQNPKKEERAGGGQGNEGLTPAEAERLRQIRENPFGALVVNDVASKPLSTHRITIILDDEDIEMADEIRKGQWVQVPAKDGGTRARPMTRTEVIQRCMYAGLREGLKKKTSGD